jgi:hypothetical protein
MSPLAAAAALALACGVSVDMKVIGFDAKNARVAVRVEQTGDVNEIRVDVVELKTGAVVESFGIVETDDAEDKAKALRGKRWKDAEAKLKAAKFTSTTGVAAMPKSGVTVPGGLALSLRNVGPDEDSGFSGNELVAERGKASASLLSLTGPPSDSPSIMGVYLSPDQKYAVAVEGGCVNGKTYVFELGAVAKKLK